MSEAPDEAMLGRLRELEVKMGLVLTLVRAPLPRLLCVSDGPLPHCVLAAVQGIRLGRYQRTARR